MKVIIVKNAAEGGKKAFEIFKENHPELEFEEEE